MERTSRRTITPAQREKILEKQKYLCAGCGCGLVKGKYEIDHGVPLALGGADSAINLFALCTPCHREKTYQRASDSFLEASRKDRTMIAKADRMGKVHRGEKKRSKRWNWSKFKRKVDGTVIRRG